MTNPDLVIRGGNVADGRGGGVAGRLHGPER
jgi:hypothetical protein